MPIEQPDDYCPECGGCGTSDDWRDAVLDENEQRIRGECPACAGTGIAADDPLPDQPRAISLARYALGIAQKLLEKMHTADIEISLDIQIVRRSVNRAIEALDAD
jgi:hypothetical protein